MRAATVAGALWLLGVGAQPEPRYICLQDIKSAAEDPKHKEFCEAGEDQCFDLYNASVSQSDILPQVTCNDPVNNDCCKADECYCSNDIEDHKTHVLKVDSMPIDEINKKDIKIEPIRIVISIYESTFLNV